mgnify:CR=1
MNRMIHQLFAVVTGVTEWTSKSGSQLGNNGYTFFFWRKYGIIESKKL